MFLNDINNVVKDLLKGYREQIELLKELTFKHQ